MKIGNWESGIGKTFIIAEIGGNHEGYFIRAQRMMTAAARAGADAVKFQVYNADKLVHPSMPSLAHAGTHHSQLERMRSLQLSVSEYILLAESATQIGVVWLASVFDEQSADLVASLAPAIKIASGELTNERLLRHVQTLGKPVLLSTGMATAAEIVKALMLLSPREIAALHCVSLYPTPDNQANLGVIRSLWGGLTGYSDHTVGKEACIAAAALGAEIIEKHFTDLPPGERDIPGDHRLSLDEKEFAEMVRSVRRVEAMLKPWDKGERPDIGNRPFLRRDPVTGLRMGMA